MSILFNSDPVLQQYASDYNPSDVEAISSARKYVTKLLSVDVDKNGDYQITRDELIAILNSQSIETFDALPLW